MTRFTIVTAVYDVGRYLDEFIASVDAQTFPRDEVQVVAVDDGSTDDSLARLQAWAARRPGVTVLTKENGGQASARNLGLGRAVGEWVTFPDPDDVLDPDYLRAVDQFLRQHPETPMIGTRRLLLNDATGELTDTHPLRGHFGRTDRLRFLDEWPRHFYGSAPAAFFRRDRVEQLGLRFPENVRPNFEDGHFCGRYLLSWARPGIGFVRNAAYHYRKRADGSSTLQTSLRHPGRYTDVLRNGYLPLLREAGAGRQHPPEWLQNWILYELSWYFTTQDGAAGTGSAAPAAVTDEFHGLLAEVTRHLEREVVAGFTLRPIRPSLRAILTHAYGDQPWRQPYGWLDRTDKAQRVVRLRYHFTGPLPHEEIVSRGTEVEPVAAKVRPLRYHGRDLLWERILWLPASRSLLVHLDGNRLDLVRRRPLPRRQLGEPGGHDDPAATPSRPAGRGTVSPGERLLRRMARTGPVRRRFGRAWVLMDRIHDAGDSGEVLFRHLRKHRRKINAWFVVERDSPDYRRLRQEGYRRIIAHGSLVWKLLMLNAEHLISSHADQPVLRPPAITRLTKPTWRFTFLQHGVIKDDLSGWLNPKSIDLFVVSTRQEYDSIIGDDSPYVFTGKEVVQTGLPRFDRLREVGRRVPEADRDLILLTPTWRNWLLPPLTARSQRRTAYRDFFDSDFVRQWLGLLRSPELAALAAEQNLTIGFLPHPNLQQALSGLCLPPGVESLSYAGQDVQTFFARAAVLITDYSSIAFNAAYIDRPVVYYQFDADRLSAGDHVGRPGYFDYRRDGFGPVTETLEEALAAIAATVRAGRRPTAPYAQRIADTFGERDGQCCDRVTAAILASTRRRRSARAAESTPRRAIAAAARTGQLAELTSPPSRSRRSRPTGR